MKNFRALLNFFLLLGLLFNYGFTTLPAVDDVKPFDGISRSEALSKLYSLKPKEAVDKEIQSGNLWLSGLELDDDDLNILVPFCSTGEILDLNLGSNQITGSGFARLSKSCPNFSGLTSLDLSSNGFSDQHLKHLSIFISFKL